MCESYIWKAKEPDRVERTANGDPIRRVGDSIPLRCMECPKVPQWAKEKGKDWRELRTLAAEDMTAENRAAYDHYRECRAVGVFPDDALVRWVAAIVREVEDEAARRPVERQTEAVKALCQLITLRLRK